MSLQKKISVPVDVIVTRDSIKLVTTDLMNRLDTYLSNFYPDDIKDLTAEHVLRHLHALVSFRGGSEFLCNIRTHHRLSQGEEDLRERITNKIWENLSNTS
jgi:hypothetical protein